MQKVLGVMIGRVMECGETPGNEGGCQGEGAVDLDAVTPRGMVLWEMLGHGRLLDEEMNAGAQDDSDRLAFGELMLFYNTSSSPRSLASRVLPSSVA